MDEMYAVAWLQLYQRINRAPKQTNTSVTVTASELAEGCGNRMWTVESEQFRG